ncbi:EAL domain-containing protein [Pseudodesulfovibrio cashew]|uniref:EAL domain-containing protein n=1 Tax=Pseudodesulfovibrio cashew TaxID=2678688 RepID=A0A6I6JFS5_9BACT|nr:EAL domain-containing protein [Pseudodesulfovibrio cashew]QGY38867.1 EAL domain-containing protein [Pseudodesulfovibrio cashew]
MPLSLRNLSIKYRLMVWFTGFIFVSSLVASSVAYYSIRSYVEQDIVLDLGTATDGILTMVGTSAKVSVRNRLRAIAEKNIDILHSLEKAVQAGSMSQAVAKETAKRVLLSQTIGKTGYIYVIKSDGVIVVHPSQALVGRNLSKESLGQQQAKRHRGYLEYEWANPDDEEKRPKAMYMEYFAPWDWIVSVSSYRDEFRSLIDVADFRKSVQSFALGEIGHAAILNNEGKYLVAPTATDGKPHDAISPALLNRMKGLDHGRIIHTPETGPNKGRATITFFRRIPNLGWIVTASSCLDEAYAPLYRLRNIILGIVAFTLLCSIPLALKLGSAVATPLTRLADSMSKADKGDLSVRAEINGQGEIGQLAQRFNQYMGQLEEYRDGLETEIDERRRAEQQLKLFAMVFDNALEGITISDKNGAMLAVNPAFTAITGFEPEEVLGQNPRVLKSEHHNKDFYREMWQSLIEYGSWHGEIWNRRKNGESFPEILSISSIRDENGKVSNYVAVFHDISDMKRKDKELEHQAYHDALTGLPNRALAHDRLTMAIAHARRENTKVAILYLDIDDFKKVNDQLGYSAGDVLIQEVADRLSTQFRDADTVARLGGDEYLILAEHMEDEREVVELADRVLLSFDEPYLIHGQELTITPSVGVTMYPDDGDDAGTLIRNADMAMYQAKSAGKRNYLLYTQEINERISRRIELENDMRRALKEEEFTVYFQPKVNQRTGKVMGMEALVRWNKADGSVVSPGDFIPLAEETGLIVPLGEYVLGASCKAMQLFEGLGCSNIKVSVNLSPIQFEQQDLVEMVIASLEHNGLNPSKLELEITESTLMTDVNASVAKLEQLVDHGISISIDDFGTGHSSLYYLKNFPIDVIKIDQSFVRDITSDASDAQIVETIILMARNLGLAVVAEGVETEEQLSRLNDYGCELIQGYYYSPPLPLEGIVAYLQERNTECF